MGTAANDPTWGDAALLASTGFRDTTRLAAGSPEMYRDICLTNGASIVRWLDQYVDNLSALRDRIAMHDKSLSEDFARVQQLRQEWQSNQNEK
jgi:prephenate dehydrogenase